MAEKVSEKKYVSNKEFIIYLMCVFFFSNMNGMVEGYRQAYLVNVLQMESQYVSIVNAIVSFGGFGLSFFYAMIMDRAPKPGKGKFGPLIAKAAIPFGVFSVMMFITPQMPVAIMIAYLCIIGLLQNASYFFGDAVNRIGAVITPNNSERDKILSFKGMSSAIGNSAPLVVVLVLGLLRPNVIKTEAVLYIVSATLCAVACSFTMLFGIRAVKERVTYSSQRQNPLLGFRDVIKNKYAVLMFLSELLKSFREIAIYMGVFLSVALLGDPSKYILFGLPTGIGTFVGMLIVNALLKKFSSKQIYIASGIYSIIANIGAYLVGLNSFRNPDNTLIQIIFFAFLFLIGLQFGASNLLPEMFKADILEDLEVKTHKRLDGSLHFVTNVGTTTGKSIARTLAPMVLYGANSFIQYLQPVTDELGKTVYLEQSFDTKKRLLLVYTIFHGAMMLLAGVPFLFYKLTGETKEQVHEEVLAYRESLKQSGAED